MARRIYLTGHSGGSRVALQIALANKAIAGVIASSAGYPDVRPRASVSFPIFATAGVDDFNYIEMRMLGRALKTPHRVVIFKGGHTLPPPDVAMQAIEWLELQAMASGLRTKDDTLVDQFWATQERAVADDRRDGRHRAPAARDGRRLSHAARREGDRLTRV